MAYTHVQWGWTWLLYLIFSVVMTVVIIVGIGDSGDDEALWVTAATVVFLVVLFFVVLAFSRLEVTVDAENVTAAFGLGYPKKVVAHTDVVAVREVRNNWWQGWGVRNISNGWMYNVWGLDAVELEMADGKVFRIGTDDSERLAAALILR
ncbi:MAG: hypothetical protein ACR2NG_07505 [Acidimicrobiia bacterium]